MVGSMSFSSGARISVIRCFAVQSIAALFLGCQQNSCWNDRQTEVDSPTMVKTIHLTSLAVSLLATRVLSVALLYSSHCLLFTTFSTGTYNTSTFSPILQSYFTMPLEDLLRRAPPQRKCWLRQARLATSHSTAMGTCQQFLSTYFPYAPSVHEGSAVSSSLVVQSSLPQMKKQISIK
jgi:hypothetical protein